MNPRKRVEGILKLALRQVGLDGKIKIMLYPMKRKIASVSLKTKTIRLNKNIIDLLNDRELYYIIVHELIHVKLSSLYHGEEFYKQLHKIYHDQEYEKIEKSLLEKLSDVYNSRGLLL